MSETLAQLSRLRQELAKATTFDEVKTIVDKAEALRVLAKRIGASLETQNQIAEDRLRAERLGGEMLRDGERQRQGRPKKTLQPARFLPKLSEIGIEQTQAHRWQQLAGIPKKDFDRLIRETLETDNEELTRALLLGWAKEQAKQTRRKERIKKITELSTLGQYPVIYADPPWEYDFMSVDAWKVENHYPTMATEDICALPVFDVATEDAILFLWATAPKLVDAIQVIRAWDFTYKTCAIWDKKWTGMGNYFRIQHELLLIATRGEIPPPITKNRPASIVRHKRSTTHSEKPDVFYDIIEAMYPELPKLELFARTPREGWINWGNEIGDAGDEQDT